MKAIIRHGFDFSGYGLWVYQDTGSQIRMVKPAVLELGEPHANDEAWELPPPTFRFPKRDFEEFQQTFREELIRLALMTDHSATEGELKAQAKHLADMQKLVFDFMERGSIGGRK